MLLATLQVMQDDERRTLDRVPVDRVSTLRGSNAKPIDIMVRDFSADGFRFVTDARFEVGNVVRVGLAGAGTSDARIVRRTGNEYGCSFLTPLSPQRMAEAFSQAEVVDMPASSLIGEGYAEPVLEKWPGSVRVAILVAGSALLWGGITAISAFLH